MDEPAEIVTCPERGKKETLENFDVLFADDNNVFCTDCHCEFDPATGIINEG